MNLKERIEWTKLELQRLKSLGLIGYDYNRLLNQLGMMEALERLTERPEIYCFECATCKRWLAFVIGIFMTITLKQNVNYFGKLWSK